MYKTLWIKFGCFLTGYDFDTMIICSQVSKNYLKKITAALLLVSIVWIFVGFLFCTNYLQSSYFGATFGGCIALIVIIQIERQIILSARVGTKSKILRLLFGLTVAIIGSAIIDQVLFRNDIDIRRIDNLDALIKKRAEKEDLVYYSNQQRIFRQMTQDSIRLISLDNQILKHPTITGSVSHIRGYNNNGELQNTGKTITKILSPTIAERERLQNHTQELNKQLGNAQEEYTKKIDQIKNQKQNEKRGFLDDLQIMLSLLREKPLALTIYLLWFSFFTFIELFVLISTSEKGENDYDNLSKYQMTIRENRLKILEARTTNYLGENMSVGKTRSLVDRFPS